MASDIDALVVVVMPVYNAMDTLHDSVRSILDQTWTNLVLVAVNDGSDDDSSRLLERLAAQDHRLIVVDLPENMGQAMAANIGLSLPICGRADFVARADADDINNPNRIAEQVKFLTAHPNIDICGTSVTVNGRLLAMPSDPCLARFHMLFYCSLAHPSVMIRTSSVRVKYSIAHCHRVCEDYRLWLDMLLCGKRFVSIAGPPLVHLRRSRDCLSIRHAEEQQQSAIEAARAAASALTGSSLTFEQMHLARFPSLIQSSEAAAAVYGIVSALAISGICQCPLMCPAVHDELQKRLGEIAIVSMQLGDTTLFQNWMQTGSNRDYLLKLSDVTSII